jgi:hypothetical protein
MTNEGPLLPPEHRISDVSRDKPPDPDAAVLSTRDHEVIWKWAHARSAEPSTGEETASGPASALKVADGGSALRFNFPALSRFRQISWTEWFDHFDRNHLTFVYDNSGPGQQPSMRYRLVHAEDWEGWIR